MIAKTQEEIEGLQRVGRVVSEAITRMGEAVEPGVTTKELDEIGRQVLESHGALSAPMEDVGFPAYTCISINEEAAHGIPGDRKVEKGDVVNIDVSASLDGFYADSGRTFLVPPVDRKVQRLQAATKQALLQAMKAARAGKKLNLIGKAIERTAKKHRFVVIRDLCSHGVGRSLHEDPDTIPGYFDPDDHRILEDGQVITIEPFLSTRARYVKTDSDGWTLKTPRGNRSVQFEHTMIITDGDPIITTLY